MLPTQQGRVTHGPSFHAQDTLSPSAADSRMLSGESSGKTIEHEVLRLFEVLGRLLESLGGEALTRRTEGEAAGGELERRLALLDVGVGETIRNLSGSGQT